MSTNEIHELLIKSGALEVKSKFNEYTRYFELPNGKNAILASSVPINYLTVNGEYLPFDNFLASDDSRKPTFFTNSSNRFSVLLPQQINDHSYFMFKDIGENELRVHNNSSILYLDSAGKTSLISRASPQQ